MKPLLTVLALLFSLDLCAQGLALGNQLQPLEVDPVVIDPQLVEDLEMDMEEPVFSIKKAKRLLAFLTFQGPVKRGKWQGGKLLVVKEIPYSYPWLSHGELQRQVLGEMKKEEASSQK